MRTRPNNPRNFMIVKFLRPVISPISPLPAPVQCVVKDIIYKQLPSD